MCCGATPDDGETQIHVDHIKPRFKYPQLALNADNLQVLCSVCNQGKGKWDESDFRSCVDDENARLEQEFQIALADKATTFQ
jgi:5-methylcytosine-specific restriction endonuclease McrA